MLEVLQYYTSGFWVWLGLTLGIFFTGQAIRCAVWGYVEDEE